MKFVTVKIAVLVNERGEYSAYGYTGFPENPDTTVLHDVLEGVENEASSAKRLVWVEARAPLPEVETIVVPADSVTECEGSEALGQGG